MAIAKKSYSSILGNKPKKTIELGLAISGYGTRVKAAFGPAKTKASPQSKRQSKGASSKV
jgi:hypothetical protein